MKIGIVVQRYGEDVTGGAELHARLIAENLKFFHEVEVFTTCAKDYITWKNEYPPGTTEVQSIPVHRFPVEKPRNPDVYARIEKQLLYSEHSIEEELLWLKEEGPYSPALVHAVRQRKDDFDAWIHFSFRYYTTVETLKVTRNKGFLVPTAEEDPIIYFKIFRELFHLPAGIFYNSIEEKRLIQGVARNYTVPGIVVGVGIEEEIHGRARIFYQRYNIGHPFMLYVGRIDVSKGVDTLMRWYVKMASHAKRSIPDLVLIGAQKIPLVKSKRIHYLGFVDPQTKFDAISACESLVNPSALESLSMIVLEAWHERKPVLVNGKCAVLKGQVIRAQGGLYYETYSEFAAMVKKLHRDHSLRKILGENGYEYYSQHYTWNKIIEKYHTLFREVLPHIHIHERALV